MSSAKKRRSLTIEEKRNIILNLESGCSNTFVSQQYNLSNSTVSNIFKQRTEIKRMFDRAAFTTKKIRYSVHRDIENALLEWLKCANAPINIPSLQAKADELGKSLGKTDFKCSSSWVQRFKRRYHNEFARIKNGQTTRTTSRGVECVAVKEEEEEEEEVEEKEEEREFTPREDAVDWLQNVWPVLRRGYTDDEIYNADETGLYYKLTPDQSFKFEGQKCAGGEFSKERLTVLVTANMTGTDKRKLLVVGKPKNPRSFKNIKTLPVQYEYNRKSWMTSSIFKKYLRQWDTELLTKFKKVLLLVDDHLIHTQFDQLRCIKAVSFPSGNVPFVQPMNRGIIKSLKLLFKKQIILHHVRRIENNEIPKINLFQAVCMLESAWEQILPQMIVNCFGNAELKEIESESIKEERLDSWAANILYYDAKTLDKFENVDFEIATFSQEYDDYDVDEGETNMMVTSEDEDTETEIEKVTLNQAFDALNKLKQFLATNEHFPKSYNHTKQIQILLEKSLYKQKISQTKITNYFKRLK